MPKNVHLVVATAIHTGDREYQQDRVAILQHPYNKQCLLVVIADGMGGSSGGALASGQVIKSARGLLEQFDVESDDPEQLMLQVLTDAHSVIRMFKVTSEHNPYSTMAAYLLMPDGTSHWVHSGDSRIYHFRQGQLIRRTRDHSLVQGLIDKGEITEQQAINHPKNNVLAGCLGMKETPPFDQLTVSALRDGEALVSCTDGLWAYCSDIEIAKIVDALSPTEACKRLLDIARERANGDGDNLSMVVLKARSKEI